LLDIIRNPSAKTSRYLTFVQICEFPKSEQIDECRQMKDERGGGRGAPWVPLAQKIAAQEAVLPANAN